MILIVSVLLGLLLPALRITRARARELNCASNLRSVTLEFQFFVDNQSPRGRGDSERLGPNRFRINDFLDNLYRLDEFWDLGPAPQGVLTAGREMTMCPAAAPRLTKRAGFPCGAQALEPLQDVSLGVNLRLYRGLVLAAGQTLLAPVNTTSVRTTIRDHSYVPLIMDVDGAEAKQRGLDPFYLAPPVTGENGPLSTGRYWMPARRHPGGINVAFVGGEVLRSPAPEKESWNWSYRANVGD